MFGARAIQTGNRTSEESPRLTLLELGEGGDTGGHEVWMVGGVGIVSQD